MLEIVDWLGTCPATADVVLGLGMPLAVSSCDFYAMEYVYTEPVTISSAGYMYTLIVSYVQSGHGSYSN